MSSTKADFVGLTPTGGNDMTRLLVCFAYVIAGAIPGYCLGGGLGAVITAIITAIVVKVVVANSESWRLTGLPVTKIHDICPGSVSVRGHLSFEVPREVWWRDFPPDIFRNMSRNAPPERKKTIWASPLSPPIAPHATLVEVPDEVSARFPLPLPSRITYPEGLFLWRGLDTYNIFIQDDTGRALLQLSPNPGSRIIVRGTTLRYRTSKLGSVLVTTAPAPPTSVTGVVTVTHHQTVLYEGDLVSVMGEAEIIPPGGSTDPAEQGRVRIVGKKGSCLIVELINHDQTATPKTRTAEWAEAKNLRKRIESDDR
jgi:hypothetical protein